MKSLAKICLVCIAAISLSDLACQAQSNAPAAPSTNTPAHPRPPRAKPIIGTIASSDSTAKTVTITLKSGETQVIHVTSKTKFHKDGVAGTFADATVGEKIRATARKNEAGEMDAVNIYIGEPKKPAAKPSTE